MSTRHSPSDESLLAFERDGLARDLRASTARRAALTATVEEMAGELAILRRRTEAAEAALVAATATLEHARAHPDVADDSERDKRLRRLAWQRRELLADLADAQKRLADRTEQVIDLRNGRWHRAAGVVWRLRKRTGRSLLLIAGGLMPGALFGAVSPPFGGSALLIAFGGAVAVFAVLLVREWREHPRFEERWVKRLRTDDARVMDMDSSPDEAVPVPALAAEPAPAPAQAAPTPAPPQAAPPAPAAARAGPSGDARFQRSPRGFRH